MLEPESRPRLQLKIVHSDSPEMHDFIPLKTARLELRPLLPSDAGEIEKLLNDRELASNTESIDFPYPPETLLAGLIETTIAGRWARPMFWPFAKKKPSD